MSSTTPPELEGYTLANQNIVMYPHLSRVDRLFGGQLLSWIDEGAAMLAMKLMGTHRIVLKKMSEVIFEAPGLLGDIIEIWCRPLGFGTTSITLNCRAMVCRDQVVSRTPACHCDIVFVAIDGEGRPQAWRNPAN